jgi:hypothetical protein
MVPSRHSCSAIAVALVVVAATGCGDNPPTVDPNDKSAPAPVAMDAHVPTGAAQTLYTVSLDSGDRSVGLSSLPEITLIATARDPESAIGALQIDVETTLVCEMGDVGEEKHAVLKKKAPLSAPSARPVVSLNIDTARPDGACLQGDRLVSVDGEATATARNGAGLGATSATLSFSFRRP